MYKEKRKISFWFALNRPKMRFKKRTKKNGWSCLDIFLSLQSDRFFFLSRLNRFLMTVLRVVEPLGTSIREKLRVRKPSWYEQLSG